MSEAASQPKVTYIIYEDITAMLWANVPQLGIGIGGDWGWGLVGALQANALEKAVEELRQLIQKHCMELIDRGGTPETTADQLLLARRILAHGFELVEDRSIPTIWDRSA